MKSIDHVTLQKKRQQKVRHWDVWTSAR